MLLNLVPSTKEATRTMFDLGLGAMDTNKAMQFLEERGIKPQGSSWEELAQQIHKYLEEQEGLGRYTKEHAKAWEKLLEEQNMYSSAFYDAHGKIKSLADISQLLKEKLAHLTDAQRQQALQTMFGTDAIRATNILYKEGADGVKNMYTEMSKVTAADVATTKINTLSGRIELLKSAFSTMKKTIGDALAPVISVFVAGLQKLVDGFNSLPAPVQKTIAIIGGVVLALTAVATAIGVVLAATGAIVSGIGALATALGIVGGAAGLASARSGCIRKRNCCFNGASRIGSTALIGTGVVAYKAYQKATEDSIDSVNRFAENTEGKVSSSTKKVLGEYFKLSDGIRQKLTEIRLNHEVITEEQSQKLIGQYDKLANTIIEKNQRKATKRN